MAVYELRGLSPRLGRDVYVADSAAVIGDAELGDESSVWFGAVLRADYGPIRVGARTNLQDNVVVHISTERPEGAVVGADVTVGHSAVIHACTIGDRCLIGIGSIVLDGAVVGDESFVGAGSLITPETVIPPRSFVLGRPAKVMRPTRDWEVDSIRESAAHYVRFARDFHAGCRRI